MKKFFSLILFIVGALNSYSQINESTNNTSYDFLYRMAQKGLIEIQDYITPLSRDEINKSLQALKLKDSLLTNVEKKELAFYIRDFYYDNYEGSVKEKASFLKKDKADRFRTLYIVDDKVRFFLDPIVGASYSHYNNGMHNISYYNGVRLYGNIGKHIGLNISFRDITESGDSLNSTKKFTPVTGIINTSQKASQLNYSDLNFNIGYKWANGSVNIGKDHLNWGYGIAGKIVLSSKAPSFPYISLDYKPFKWLRFNYFNAWLASNIVDSSRSYNTGAPGASIYRTVDRSKFMAHHSISIVPVKGLDISIGESMIYSDKLDVAYLVPVNFFKAYDQYASNYGLNSGSNSQFFGQISSRNQIKNTHLYLVCFIDELKLSKIFDRVQSRNQLGYTIGVNRTDLFAKYLTLGFEYTHINPFVYNNLIPAQTYESSSSVMGDWMGNNADRLYLYLKYTPIARLKFNLWFQSIRKGGAGTLQQQYNIQPQPDFLFDRMFDKRNVGLDVSYELINKLVLNFNYNNEKTKYYNGLPTTVIEAVSLGFSYGL